MTLSICRDDDDDDDDGDYDDDNADSDDDDDNYDYEFVLCFCPLNKVARLKQSGNIRWELPWVQDAILSFSERRMILNWNDTASGKWLAQFLWIGELRWSLY